MDIFKMKLAKKLPYIACCISLVLLTYILYILNIYFVRNLTAMTESFLSFCCVWSWKTVLLMTSKSLAHLRGTKTNFFCKWKINFQRDALGKGLWVLETSCGHFV